MVIDPKDIPEPRGIEKKTIKEQIKDSLDKKPIQPTIKIKKPELNMYGIEETKDAVKAICGIGNGISAALADDGKITLGDYYKFIGPLMKLPAAITGIGEIPKELADLTKEEKLELIALVESELEVGDKAEEVTVRILNIIYEIKSFVDFIK